MVEAVAAEGAEFLGDNVGPALDWVLCIVLEGVAEDWEDPEVACRRRFGAGGHPSAPEKS